MRESEKDQVQAIEHVGFGGCVDEIGVSGGQRWGVLGHRSTSLGACCSNSHVEARVGSDQAKEFDAPIARGAHHTYPLDSTAGRAALITRHRCKSMHKSA
jgi:hypothetical protein